MIVKDFIYQDTMMDGPFDAEAHRKKLNRKANEWLNNTLVDEVGELVKNFSMLLCKSCIK